MNQILDSIGVALSSVWTNKLRSFMMILGNVVAVTSIIAVVSLIRGMDTYVANAIIGEVGAGTFQVERVGFVTNEEEEQRARRRIGDRVDPAVDRIDDVDRSLGQSRSREGEENGGNRKDMELLHRVLLSRWPWTSRGHAPMRRHKHRFRNRGILESPDTRLS